MATTNDDSCPLPSSLQTRNLLIYALNVGLVYLAAPVLYVGSTQAALLEKLEASKTLANLPLTLYFWLTAVPILVAWYFCSVHMIKPVLVATYVIVAGTGAGVTAALIVPLPRQEVWVTAGVLIHAATMGWALGVVANFQWEVLGRGVAGQRRGQALALAFGVGPLLAAASAVASQPVLDNIDYPWNFAVLFAFSVPAMLLAALLSAWFVIPQPDVDIARQPFVQGVFGGIGDFVRNRLTFLAGCATFLVACGYNIINNITLYTKEAVGTLAQEYLGYQNGLRFGFKVVAGLLLGWLLTRTHPRAGLYWTGFFCLLSVVWVLVVPGAWFLVSFGLMGAGELWGVYYPNYILSASPKSRMRRNMAITSLIYMPTGFMPLVYGKIGDEVDLRASFYLSIGILVVTLLFVLFALPERPEPPSEEASSPS